MWMKSLGIVFQRMFQPSDIFQCELQKFEAPQICPTLQILNVQVLYSTACFSVFQLNTVRNIPTACKFLSKVTFHNCLWIARRFWYFDWPQCRFDTNPSNRLSSTSLNNSASIFTFISSLRYLFAWHATHSSKCNKQWKLETVCAQIR